MFTIEFPSTVSIGPQRFAISFSHDSGSRDETYVMSDMTAGGTRIVG